MGAARLLRKGRLHHLGAAAAVLCSVSHVTRRTQRTRLDSAASTWAQDENLINQGRKSLADKTKREGPDPRKEDQSEFEHVSVIDG